jgi:hypothetical protein
MGGSPQTQQMYLDDLVITSSTPNGIDSHGNKYIGVGNDSDRSRPLLHPILMLLSSGSDSTN